MGCIFKVLSRRIILSDDVHYPDSIVAFETQATSSASIRTVEQGRCLLCVVVWR